VSVNSNIDYKIWRSKVRIGDYVEVYLYQKNVRGQNEKIEELRSYDWWVFANGLSANYLKNTCQDR